MFFFCISALLSTALFSTSCQQKTDFERQRLPRDLPEYLNQLRVLKVPSSVTRLDWIPSSLEELDASGSAITAIPYVPEGLRRLDVSRAKNLTKLPILPPSLRELNIQYTQIRGPWNHPSSLESLHLGGGQVAALDGLSDSLLELSLAGAPISSTAGLPRSLQVLAISEAPLSGTGKPLLTELGKLPPRLKELHLTNTRIEALKAVPESLQALTLINNTHMKVELPTSLVSLTVGGDHKAMSPLESLKFLNHLAIQSPTIQGRPIRLQALPLFLRELRTDSIGTSWAQEIMPSLRSVHITAADIPLPQTLPRALEELRWLGGSSLKGFPAELKRVHLPSSSLTNLAGLPASVVSLDISKTSIPLDKLPQTLKYLRYSMNSFSEVAGLPRSLRVLDLSGSRDLETIDVRTLPLERLDISETKVRDLSVLPGTLLELDISNTPIRKLQNLPPKLRSLTLHAGQLSTLSGLPKSVTALYFQKPI